MSSSIDFQQQNIQTIPIQQKFPEKKQNGIGSIIIGNDLFRVRSTGNLFSVLFYLGILVGLLCVAFALILTIVTGSSPEDQVKMELFQANNKWLYQQKSSLMRSQNITIEYQEDLSEKIINSLMTLEKQLQKDTQNNAYYIVGNHFEAYIAPNYGGDQTCFKLKASEKTLKNISDLKSCKGIKNSIQIQRNQKKTLSFQEMVKMNLCQDNQTCQKVCHQNKGETHIKQQNNQYLHPTLLKQLETDLNTCTAHFSVKEICLKSQINEQSKKIDSTLLGCFENSNSQIYDFDQNVKSVKLFIRDEDEPYLTILKNSNTYYPNCTISLTTKDKTAEFFYLLGSSIFLLLIFCIMIVRINQEKSQKFVKMSQESTLSPPSQVSV